MDFSLSSAIFVTTYSPLKVTYTVSFSGLRADDLSTSGSHRGALKEAGPKTPASELGSRGQMGRGRANETAKRDSTSTCLST